MDSGQVLKAEVTELGDRVDGGRGKREGEY